MAETELTTTQTDALRGTTDTVTDFDLPVAGENYVHTGIQRMQRVLTIAYLPNELRVFKDGDLTFGVRSGRWFNGDDLVEPAQVDAQSLTNNQTNYIYYTSGGVLTVNITGFPVPTATPHIRLATVLTAAGTYAYTDITDYRGPNCFVVSGGSSNIVCYENDVVCYENEVVEYI